MMYVVTIMQLVCGIKVLDAHTGQQDTLEVALLPMLSPGLNVSR